MQTESSSHAESCEDVILETINFVLISQEAVPSFLVGGAISGDKENLLILLFSSWKSPSRESSSRESSVPEQEKVSSASLY